MSAVQAWRLLGAADLAAIGRALQPLAQAWADEWLPDARLTLSVVDAHADALSQCGDGEQLLALKNEQGGPAAIVMYGSGLTGMLHKQTLGTLDIPPEQVAPVGSDSMLAALAHYQLRELPARLARLPAASARSETRYSQDRALLPAAVNGDGAVLVLLTLERHAVRVWLPQAAVAGWCRRPLRKPGAPLLARTEALAGRSLPFRLQAGCATLVLADLLALQPGNVIRLDTGPDQPMELISDHGAAFGHAYPGLQDGRPVIQLCS